MCLLFCDVDENGKIVDSLLGDRVIPLRQYQYFFYIQQEVNIVVKNLPNYQVVDGQLVLQSL